MGPAQIKERVYERELGLTARRWRESRRRSSPDRTWPLRPAAPLNRCRYPAGKRFGAGRLQTALRADPRPMIATRTPEGSDASNGGSRLAERRMFCGGLGSVEAAQLSHLMRLDLVVLLLPAAGRSTPPPDPLR